MGRDDAARPNDEHAGEPRRRTSVMPDAFVDVAAAEAEQATRRATESRDASAAEADDEATSEDEATREDEAKRRHREASRRGGLKGGRARAAKLSAERRSEIARAAARARWAKRRRDSA